MFVRSGGLSRDGKEFSVSQSRILLNAFDMSCFGHQSPGLWKHADDQGHRYKDLDYWTELAKLLERG